MYLMSLDDHDVEDVKPVIANDLDLTVCRVGGEVYVIEDICTHGHALISYGYPNMCESERLGRI